MEMFGIYTKIYRNTKLNILTLFKRIFMFAKQHFYCENYLDFQLVNQPTSHKTKIKTSLSDKK